MKDINMNKALIAIAAAGLMATACASDPYGNNETLRQGTIGAGIGAVAGAIIGNNVGDGNAGRGAAIGAVVGGAAGAIRGSQQDRNNQQRYQDAQGRYYYCYDNRQTECYWENGQRRY
ncbi:MAG: phage tail tape-measure protein [Brevundimonas sp.]|jgi:phage tail tape-measure protein|tara:strand:+ start:7749 stop:8102 length:354 start_codon:yes stop_codon:yes gene_type:complete